MKKSIRYLPSEVQYDLRRLVALFQKKMQEIKMIILYDYRLAETLFGKEPPVPDNVPDSYGFVIVTRRRLLKRRWNDLFSIYNRFLQDNGDSISAARPVFFNISLSQLNRELKAGSLFCSMLKEKGIFLYDNTGRRLARRCKFDFRKIRDDVRKYYEEMLLVADEFLWCAERSHKERKSRSAMFMLHQVAENYLHTAFYVYIQYGIKFHDIDRCLDYCRLLIPEFASVFPQNTEEDIRLYHLLQSAYIKARYDRYYPASDNETTLLLLRIRELRYLTVQVCRERFECYDRMIPRKDIR